MTIEIDWKRDASGRLQEGQEAAVTCHRHLIRDDGKHSPRHTARSRTPR